MQKTKVDFFGHTIYVGIDVHKKSWSVRIVSEILAHGSMSQPPELEKLVTYF